MDIGAHGKNPLVVRVICFFFFFFHSGTQAKYANKKVASNSSVIVCTLYLLSLNIYKLFEILFPSYVPVSSLDFNPYTTLCHHIFPV